MLIGNKPPLTAAQSAALQEAESLRAAGQLADALDRCAALLAERPECTDALWLAGTIAFDLLAYDVAESCFRQALELDPAAIRSLLGLAQVLESTERAGDAAETYRAILILDPDHAAAKAGARLDEVRVSSIPASCYTSTAEEDALLADLPEPVLVELEPTNTCNLRCRMCHVTLQPKHRGSFLDVEVYAAATRGLHHCHLIIGSEYEPTIHPGIDRILAASSENFSGIDFITNATRLHRIPKGLIAEGKFSTFNISFDGNSKETFEYIREGADYAQVVDNILATRAALAGRGTLFAINYVVTRTTLNEVEGAAAYWNKQGFDLMRTLPIQLRDATPSLKPESLYPLLNDYKAALERIAATAVSEQYTLGVRSSLYGSEGYVVPAGAHIKDAVLYSGNPQQRVVPTMRQDLQRGAWKGEGFPCKSPYTYARIRWDGSVDLCNRDDFNIGNIHENALLDIWHGEKAHAVRRYVRRNPQVCARCDYYRFCIDSPKLDLDDPSSHFANGVMDQIGKPQLITWLKAG